MAALGSVRRRMSSLTPMGPQLAPEIPGAEGGHAAHAGDSRHRHVVDRARGASTAILPTISVSR
jgi:hypothetical protein